MAMCIRAALRDTSAAKEIGEVTEGRIAITATLDDEIDFSAGKNAKELLLAKLEPR